MKLILGDCLEKLKELEENSIDSLVTDPPAGISFMGKKWDHHKGGRKEWCAWMESVMRECIRVLKPGAHGLVWAIPRTSHWTATALEDAGFEIRDVITHLFGSGFPKSLSVAKQLGKQYGCRLKRNVRLAENQSGLFRVDLSEGKTASVLVNAPIQPEADQGQKTVIGAAVVLKGQTDISLFESTETIDSNTLSLWSERLDAESRGGKTSITLTALETITGLKIWSCLQFPSTLDIMLSSEGTGTALKPAAEFWILVRKPISEKTVAANVLKWGTGGLNIDGCRIGTEQIESGRSGQTGFPTPAPGGEKRYSTGRFPANLILDEDAGKMLDEQSGPCPSASNTKPTKSGGIWGIGAIPQFENGAPYRNEKATGASRFFYCAKVSTSERNAGCEEVGEKRRSDARPNSGDLTGKFPDHDNRIRSGNHHPTVKPQKLMRYLCRLVTPPGGIVLDPFMGSGSTGLAAKSEGFQFIGIERESEYFEIAEKRIESASETPSLFEAQPMESVHG